MFTVSLMETLNKSGRANLCKTPFYLPFGLQRKSAPPDQEVRYWLCFFFRLIQLLRHSAFNLV